MAEPGFEPRQSDSKSSALSTKRSHGEIRGGQQGPPTPSQGNPQPCHLLTWRWGCRPGKQRGRPMPSWLHCLMVPQDAESEPGFKGQRRGFDHWAPSGLAPRARKGQGLGAELTASLGGSPSILLIPQWFLELLCTHPLPSRQHCPPIWCLSAPLTREAKHHQALSQARNWWRPAWSPL